MGVFNYLLRLVGIPAQDWLGTSEMAMLLADLPLHHPANAQAVHHGGLPVPGSDAFKSKFGTEPAEAVLTSLQTAAGSHSKVALFQPQAPQIFDAFAIATDEIVTEDRAGKEVLTDAAGRANAAIRG